MIWVLEMVRIEAKGLSGINDSRSKRLIVPDNGLFVVWFYKSFFLVGVFLCVISQDCEDFEDFEDLIFCDSRCIVLNHVDWPRDYISRFPIPFLYLPPVLRVLLSIWSLIYQMVSFLFF